MEQQELPFEWKNITGLARPFVKHVYPEASMVGIWHRRDVYIDPTLSVVIPTSDACRRGYFHRLLRQIDSQTLHRIELIVVRGDSRQGRAINTAVAMACGRYILTLDDDTSLPDPETFAKLVAILEDHPKIGIAGGNNVIPEEAGPFVRRVMEQVPRRSWEPVTDITDSDLAEHPCMIMRAEAFKAIGGENELLPRGLDPYLRQAFREAGWRVVVVPKVVYHHLPPATLGRLLRQFYRNGRQAAFVNRCYPQWVIETPAEHGEFQLHVPLTKRVMRFPLLLLKALLTGKPLWLACEMAYATGFAREWLCLKSH